MKKADKRSSQEPKAKPLVNSRNNGLRFSIIELRKLVGNSWVAQFYYTYSDMINPFETSIHGTSSTNCLKRVENFLETKLHYYELSIHSS